MRNANKLAFLAFSVLSFIACQSETKMGGSAQKTPEKKKPLIKKQADCLDLLNAADASAPPQLVGLWQFSAKTAEDAKAGKKSWLGWTGIIIGPNAILSADYQWPEDPSPQPIKIQLAGDLDESAEHLATLPEIETVIHHPSVTTKSVMSVPSSTVAVPPVNQGIAQSEPVPSNEWDRMSENVVIYKSRLANLPKYFSVSQKRRLPGEQVTLLGTGDRIDLDYDTPAKNAPAIGTNTLLDSAALPQEFSWLKNDSSYLIGGRRKTTINSSTSDSMPGHGDAGSAMVQGTTLVGMTISFDRQDINGLLGKESLAVYLDLSSKFAQELIAAAIEKKAEIVKENDKPVAPECKPS